jgi:hypothetical protein
MEEATPSAVDAFVTRLRQDRVLQIAILVGVALAILLPAGMALSEHLAEQSDQAAWAEFNKAMQSISQQEFTIDPLAAAAEALPKLEQALPKVEGSTAEPWLLLQIGDNYFKAGQVKKAEETFLRLKSRFPQHPLVSPDHTTDPQPRVERALSDCAVQLRWEQEHAPLKPRSELEAPPPDSGTEDAAPPK